MLARIKFVSNSRNFIHQNDLPKLEEFLGEQVRTNGTKRDEQGNIAPLSWSDTTDENKAAENSTYEFVRLTEYLEIEDSTSFLVNLELFTTQYPNFEVTFKGLPKGMHTDNTSLLSQIGALASKIEAISSKFDKNISYNEKCEIHVPNLGLLNINRLGYATDICTESLQEILDKGWRILAVCPQPDQRRPDYILGMHFSKIDGEKLEVVQF